MKGPLPIGKLLIHATTWMDPINIVLTGRVREGSQTEKAAQLCVCEVSGIGTATQTESSCMVSRAGMGAVRKG